jgi:hypothetical protein
MANYTKQEAKNIVIQSGSVVTELDNTPYVTTVDKNNLVSSWLVVPSSKPKVDYTQVTKAIDVEISELRPNIPQTTNDFISREEYNTLLSQSIELNTTIESLRNQTEQLSSRITELEGQTDEEINNRLAIQQTNIVLVNQLTSLSKTVDGFAQQISTALQKSVEESIFRTSLQAQNKGYEAQIQALITQADSLNAVITGLYAQLGAAVVQLEVENRAQTLAAGSQGFNINEVVIVKEKIGTSLIGSVPYEFYFAINNDSPYSKYKWINGGNLTFTNVNRVPVKVTLEVFYPRSSGNSGNQIKFFKFNPITFTLSGEESNRKIQTVYTSNDPELQAKLDGPSNKGSKSNYYTGGVIKIIVENTSTGVTENKIFNLALGILHKDTYN